ncbi:MAG: PepSY domain-containing protein [Clostridia bacterium]|nr:PepSY domain-containing protein [Clostridia bacterium]MBQ4338007.1 PepSY domain-containing protein [Clostridia bacterium]
MKKNLFKVSALTLSAALLLTFAACSANTSTTQTPDNNAPASKAQVTSSAVKEVTLDEAINLALEHAKVTKEDAKFTKTQLDNDDKTANYEIEFNAGDKEYDYEVAVSDGRILKSEVEALRSAPAKVDTTKASPDASEPAPSAPAKENSGYISVDEAKQTALKAAGVAAEDAVFEKAEFDGNDLIPNFDVEFYANGYEYDYEINAKDGKVLASEKEKEAGKSVSATADYITADKAKEIALNHAGFKSADVSRLTATLDADDAIPHYEVEFRAGQYEYEYEISARNGNVIVADKELDF